MQEDLMKIDLHTDGACSGNTGPGGWCCILVLGKQEKVIRGSEAYTTNNKMELQAVIEGLKALQNVKESLDINLYSDSQYVTRTINEWLAGWVKKNFKDKANVSMWKEYLELSNRHKITAIHVKAHNGDYYNTRCDKIAYDLAQKPRQKAKNDKWAEEHLGFILTPKAKVSSLTEEELFKQLGIQND